MAEIARADANPSRTFFVRMLTRDISVEDCILDLIDNSIDAGWRSLGKKMLGIRSGPNFSKISVEISFDASHFTISDNCGGMTLATAEKYAFTFGRKDKDPEDEAEFSIGVYGIGLKRAIFKLGTEIEVRSTTKLAKGRQAFKVPINVDTWSVDPSTDWDFPILEDEPLRHDGVRVRVENLHQLAKDKFLDTEFEDYLRDVIARDYALHLYHGLKVSLNGNPVQGEVFELLTSQGFEPLFYEYDDPIDGEQVHVEVTAGLAFPPPSDNEPRDRSEREEKSGWYVACNGRIVMAADKTSLSVWGDEFPGWHPQYTGFFGLIAFSSDRTDLLPLTTTKRSVDIASTVYRRARPRMKEPTRAFIDYTNARKTQLADAETREKGAKHTPIFKVSVGNRVITPKLTKTGPRETSIQFRVPLDRVKKLARAFGNVALPNSEVGRQSFDYAFDDMVDGE